MQEIYRERERVCPFGTLLVRVFASERVIEVRLQPESDVFANWRHKTHGNAVRETKSNTTKIIAQKSSI